MKNNTISVSAYLVNGSANDILTEASPTQAIEEYLFPDMRPPVENLVITAKTNDGKLVTISIGKKTISASIEPQ
ncbi:MAG: hypothetical protein ABUT20_25310 [Bacteroidota bacterium]